MNNRKSRTIGRRTLLAAAGIGAAASVVPSATRRTAAQEQLAIGNPDIPHSTDTSKGTVTVYSSWPLGGAYTQAGGDAVDAIRFGLGQLGNAGGGYAINYIPLDDGIVANGGGWDAAKESANVITAINEPSTVLYIGTYNSGAAKIAIPMTNEAGLAMISPFNNYPGLTVSAPPFTQPNEPDAYYPTGTRTYFRNNAHDLFCCRAEAQWMRDQGWDRVYVLQDQSLWGKVVADIFRSEFEKLGGTIVGFDGYDPKGTDYMAIMASVANQDPGVIYLATNPDSNPGKVIQDVRAYMDDSVKLLVTATLDESIVTSAGEAADGTFFSSAGLSPAALEPKGGPVAEYVQSMRERLGREPNFWSLHGLEIAYLLVQALDAAGSDTREDVLAALANTTNFTGVYGNTWSFTETGDPDNFVFAIYQWKDDAWIEYAVLGDISTEA